MFLVSDWPTRVDRIRAIAKREPVAAAILAVVHFEWTLRRTIIGLGASPNSQIRKALATAHGTDALKDVWKAEIASRGVSGLPKIVRDWSALLAAYKLRHLLVHGVESCSAAVALKRASAAVDAATDIEAFARKHGLSLGRRLPVRRKRANQPLQPTSVEMH
ncbi:MAG: hypothetical protein AB7H88_17755 [Vicinamibacterales bacterium]